MSPKVLLSVIIAVLGFASLIFLAGTGISFAYTNASKGVASIALGNTIWGGGDYGMAISAGLVVAFFLTIASSLFVLGVGGFQYIAIISMLLFVTSGVLVLCSVPLCAASIEVVGKGVAHLGWGAYAYGILNILCGVGCFFALRGD